MCKSPRLTLNSLLLRRSYISYSSKLHISPDKTLSHPKENTPTTTTHPPTHRNFYLLPASTSRSLHQTDGSPGISHQSFLHFAKEVILAPRANQRLKWPEDLRNFYFSFPATFCAEGAKLEIRGGVRGGYGRKVLSRITEFLLSHG